MIEKIKKHLKIFVVKRCSLGKTYCSNCSSEYICKLIKK